MSPLVRRAFAEAQCQTIPIRIEEAAWNAWPLAKGIGFPQQLMAFFRGTKGVNGSVGIQPGASAAIVALGAMRQSVSI